MNYLIVVGSHRLIKITMTHTVSVSVLQLHLKETVKKIGEGVSLAIVIKNERFAGCHKNLV